jgi:hypothetical protein
VLDDQVQGTADTPKAVTFIGFISDDFSSEFDPASPSFGEKFAVPNSPVHPGLRTKAVRGSTGRRLQSRSSMT